MRHSIRSTYFGTQGGALALKADLCYVLFAMFSMALAWGCNKDSEDPIEPPPPPPDIPEFFSSIAAGYYFSLALEPDGTLWAWGSNQMGQLGDSTTIDRTWPVSIDSGYIAISAGGAHALGIKKDNSLWAWGSNLSGRLGDGTQENKLQPTKIDTGYIAISAGNDYSLAIKRDGSLWAWGSNVIGQLGDGTTIDQLKPVRIGSSFSKIDAGDWHSLAIKDDATLWAWPLGAPFIIGHDYLTISAGKGGQSVAVKLNGDLMQYRSDMGFVMTDTGYVAVATGLWSAGLNSYSEFEFGIKEDGTLMDIFHYVQKGTGFSAISVSWDHLLALKTDGTLWALGSNYYGQLGDGTTTARNTLAQIGGQ